MDEVANLSNEQIESELVAHAAWEATAMGKVLDLLAEFDRRKLWESWGAYSAQQWLGWKCGLGYIAASERLRVARALRDLPWIRNAISRGKLSYSKVRELTRVVTAATDRCLGEIATAATAPHVGDDGTPVDRTIKLCSLPRAASRQPGLDHRRLVRRAAEHGRHHVRD